MCHRISIGTRSPKEFNARSDFRPYSMSVLYIVRIIGIPRLGISCSKASGPSPLGMQAARIQRGVGPRVLRCVLRAA